MVNTLCRKETMIMILMGILMLMNGGRGQMNVFPENNLAYDSIYKDDLVEKEEFKYVVFAAAINQYVDEYSGVVYQNVFDCRSVRNPFNPAAYLTTIDDTNLKGLYSAACAGNVKYTFLQSVYKTKNDTAIFEMTVRMGNRSKKDLSLQLNTCTSIDSDTQECLGMREITKGIILKQESIHKFIIRWNRNSVWTNKDVFATAIPFSINPGEFQLYFFTENYDNKEPDHMPYIHSYMITSDLGREVRALDSDPSNLPSNNGCIGSHQCYSNGKYNYCENRWSGYWNSYPSFNCGTNGCIPNTFLNRDGFCVACDKQCGSCFNNSYSSCKGCFPTAVDNSWYSSTMFSTGQPCPSQYITLTKFKDFKVDVPIPTNHRMTIEFWMFIHNTKDMSDTLLRPSVSCIKLKDFFTICIMPQNLSAAKVNVDVWLFPFELFYPFKDDIVSLPQLNQLRAEYPDIQSMSFNIPNPSSKWVHVRGGISYPHSEMFIDGNKKPLTPIQFFMNNTPPSTYETFIRKFYRKNDKTKLIIQGFAFVNTYIYVRNINVFNEYLRNEISSKYFDLHKIGSFDLIPSLLFAIPLDYTDINGATLLAYAKLYDYSGQYQIKIDNKVQIDTFAFDWIKSDLKPPKNFRRLKLLEGGKNQQFSSTDLSGTKGITCRSDAICFDDAKPLVCDAGRSLKYTPGIAPLPDTIDCVTNCNGSMRLPDNKLQVTNGSRINKDYCLYDCDANVNTCPNNGATLDTFSCKLGFTPMFFKCIDNTLHSPSKSALQFSGTLNTHSIEFDLNNSYNNFLLEMWFHPELLYQVDPPLEKRHLLKTDAHELYFSPGNNSLIFTATAGGIESSFLVNQKIYYYGWNHLILLNKPIQSNTYSEWSLSILNNLEKIGSAMGLSPMSKVCFCNKELCCGASNILWMDVWVREIKIWNAGVVNANTLIDYDKFSYVLPAGLLHFIPFQIDKNMNMNGIKDTIKPTVIATYPSHVKLLNPDNDSMFNYGWNFSWNDVNYPKFATKPVIVNPNKVKIDRTKEEQCYVGCSICFGTSKNSCFKCNPGYALSGSTCTLTSKNQGDYYYNNPLDNGAGAPLSLEVATLNLNNHQSITFICYIKIYGFTTTAIASGQTEVIIFDSLSQFMLKYNANTFELNLLLNGVTQYTYPNFIERFGEWVPISIAAFRSNDIGLQLHMTSMTLGATPLKKLIDPPPLFPFKEITIAKGMIGLISQVTLYNQFIINALGYAQHYNTLGSLFNDNTILIRHYPMKGTTKANCILPTDTTTPTPIGIKCVEDYVAHIDQSCTDTQYVSLLGQNAAPKCIDNASKCEAITQTLIAMSNCDYLYATCDTISQNSIYNMPFAYSKSGVDKYIICGKSHTLDMARYSPGTIPNIQSPKDVFKMEFWFLSQSYVGINFGEFNASWHRHIKITVSYDRIGGKFHAQCYPVIDNANAGMDGIGIGFDYVETGVAMENKWRYVVCGVDMALNEYYITNLQSANHVTGTVGISAGMIPDTLVSLMIEDLSRPNFGVTYIRELRLWNCYQCSSDRAFIPLNKDDPLFSKVIHYFKFEDPTGYVKDYKTNHVSGDPAIAVRLMEKAAFNGYGLLKPIPDAPNCNESGFYYFSLRKGEGCDVLFNMNTLGDITFPKLPSSKNGRYTMDMWFYIESPDDFTKGFNIIFNEHMAISSFASTKTDTDITIYCFPQAYRDHLLNKQGNNILASFTSAQNKLSDTYTNAYSKWNYVRCAYDSLSSSSYINDLPVITLQPEQLYSIPTSHSNASPFKFFSNFYNSLIINNVKENFTRIFIQTINIFREYIPQSLSLKYLSMKNYANVQFHPLLFAVDFQNDYDIVTNKLRYYYTDHDYVPTSPIYIEKFLANSFPKTYITYPLYDDFILCGVGRWYNTVSKACEIITSPGSCDKTTTFCIENDKYFYCKKGKYLDINTLQCNDDCPSTHTRLPDIIDGQGICQLPTNQFATFPMVNTELKQGVYDTKFSCNSASESLVYYKCIDKGIAPPKESAMYFSKKYSFTNTVANYASMKMKDYFVDFWFMFEQVEQERFNDLAERRTIFIAYPHFITRKGNVIEYNNQLIPLNSWTINGVLKYEWNRIVIENYVIEGASSADMKKYINIYLNDNFLTPALSITSTRDSNFALAQIAFCSFVNDGYSTCNLGLDSSSYKLFAPVWEDAFYRDIIVWNRKSTNLSSINSYQSLYNERTTNIISFHTMRLDTIRPKNIVSEVNSPKYDMVARYNTASDYDMGQSVNYVTDFDIGAPSSTITNIISAYTDSTIPMFSLSNTEYVIEACKTPCQRCFSIKKDDCFSCINGFVLSGTACLPKTNFYFKTPTANSIATPVIDLNVSLLPYDEITIVFFMKFLGALHSTTSLSDVIPIIFFYEDKNFLGWNIATNSFCLIYDSGSVAFDYENSRNGIGKWTLFGISISKGRNNIGDPDITFPHMINLMIDQTHIQPTAAFKGIIMSTPVHYDKISLSNQVSALYYDLKVFDKFYMGSYGIGQDPNSHLLPTFKHRTLFKSAGNDDTCLTSLQAIGTGYCVGDYNQYDDPSFNCPKGGDKQFKVVNPFDQSFTCTDCDTYCTNHCYGEGIKGCTCTIDTATYWIRDTDQSYTCERLDSLNLFEYTPITIPNIGKATTSYLIEVWVFIISYIKPRMKTINISWDYFNRIEIVNSLADNDDLTVNCYPFVEVASLSKFTEKVSVKISKGKWQFLRCQVNLYTKIVTVNENQKAITTPNPPSTSSSTTKLVLDDTNASPYAYGVALIRELRIWNEQNNLFYDTARISLATDNTYKNLIHYYKNLYAATEANRNYLRDEKAKVTHPLTVTRQYNYYSYINDYESLLLCSEGQVYKLSTITNKYECEVYGSDDILDNLLNDTTLYSPDDLLTKVKVIYEMALNKYVIPPSSSLYSEVKPNATQSDSISLKDPITANSHCSNKGYAKIVDRFLCCYCFIDYVGSYCQIADTEYNTLDTIFSHYSKKAFETYNKFHTGPDVDKIISAFDYLVTGSALFSIDMDFINDFMNNFSPILYSITTCNQSLLKLVDHLYTNVFLLVNHFKVGVLTNGSSGSARNAKLNYLQKEEIKPSATTVKRFVEYVSEQCLSLINHSGANHFNFNSDNFNIDLLAVTGSFDYEGFFSIKHKPNYEPYFSLSKCLTSNAKVMYINWYNNPFYYDDDIHWNYTSSYMTVKTYDSGNSQLPIAECKENITFFLNNFNPSMVDTINDHKFHLKKENMYRTDDPIFTEPFYIEPNGKINRASIEERIEMYYFEYVLVFKTLDPKAMKLVSEGMEYVDMREEDNYFICNSNHLSEFMLTYEYNDMPNKTDGRMYFLRHFNLFANWENYAMNFGFFAIAGIVGVYLINVIICAIKLKVKKRRRGEEMLLGETLERYVFPYGNYEEEFVFNRKDGKKIYKANEEDMEDDGEEEEDDGSGNAGVRKGDDEMNTQHQTLKDASKKNQIDDTKVMHISAMKPNPPPKKYLSTSNQNLENIAKTENPFPKKNVNRISLHKNEFEDFFNKMMTAQEGNKDNNGNDNDYDTPKPIQQETIYGPNGIAITNANANAEIVMEDIALTSSKKLKVQRNNNNKLNAPTMETQANNFLPYQPNLNQHNQADMNLIEYRHNLRIYNEDSRTKILQQLNISSLKFFCCNFLNRNLIISSFRENIIYTPAIKSLYLPMYLALVLFINTLIYLFQDAMSYDLIFNKQLPQFVGFSLCAIVSANIYLYIKSLLYSISKSGMREMMLLNKAKSDKLKEVLGKNTKRFTCSVVIESIFFFIFAFLTFIFSFGLSAVYSDQGKCMVISFSLGIIADFLLSVLSELFIACLFACRRNNLTVIVLDHLNRFKSNKVLSP